MTIELTPEMESIVSDQLISGGYPSAQAVLEEALYAMRSRSQNHDASQQISLSQEEREERAKKLEELFARIDAESPIEDFEIERHTSPADQREPWLT